MNDAVWKARKQRDCADSNNVNAGCKKVNLLAVLFYVSQSDYFVTVFLVVGEHNELLNDKRNICLTKFGRDSFASTL